jgi:hypothetical protein
VYIDIGHGDVDLISSMHLPAVDVLELLSDPLTVLPSAGAALKLNHTVQAMHYACTHQSAIDRCRRQSSAAAHEATCLVMSIATWFMAERHVASGSRCCYLMDHACNALPMALTAKASHQPAC